jgi:endo-1,4-beta-xylanase
MRKKILLTVTCAFTTLLFTSCSHTKNATGSSAVPSLKQTFKNDFLVGTALSAPQIDGRDTGAARLVPQQFNAATPENIMKAEIIHPGWDKYNFDPADKLVEYAKKNGIQVTAHTLIWHSQTPAFLRGIKDADSIKQYFVNHINTVAGRYDGKVYSWDVVNEALNEDGTLRNSVFLKNLGDDYIVEAFRLAQKAAPHTKLYYNDYNIEQPKKRAGAIAVIKKIQAAGVRIDGVGIQGHWHVDNVPMQEIELSLKEFSALGIQVAFTELDLSVLPNPRGRANSADISQTAEYNAQINPYTKGLPDSMQQKLASSYANLFNLFLKYKDNISRVTFWGVNDGQSWLNGFPVPGRTNYPLLFDRQFNPKPAFYKVIETKTKGSVAIK